MSAREAAFVGCRLLSLYAFLLGVGSMATAMGNAAYTFSLSRPGLVTDYYFLTMGVHGLAQVLTAGLLWMLSDFLSALIVRPARDAAGAAPTSAPPGHGAGSEWRTFGVGLLGLWVLADAVPQLARTFGYLLQFATTSSPGNMTPLPFRPAQWPDLIALILQMILGLWLMLGAPALARRLSGPVGASGHPVP